MAGELTKRFQSLQEERTRTFKALDNHHKVFLSHAPNYEAGFDDLKKGVNVCTDIFKKVSKQIIEIKKELDTHHGDTSLGGLVGKIQELEEKKLRTVVDVQLAKQQANDNKGDQLCEKNYKLLMAGLNKLSEEINDTLMEIRLEVSSE